MQQDKMEIVHLIQDIAKEIEHEEKLARKPRAPAKIGEIFNTTDGDCIVLEYKNSRNVRVRFLKTGYETTVTIGNLRLGRVKDKFANSIYGIGCLGEASATDENGRIKKSYIHFQNMLARVTTRDNYKHVKISPAFRTFQYFEESYEYLLSFYPERNRTNLALDSDLIPFILNQDKCYSDETSILIPHSINSSFAGLVKSIKATRASAEDEMLPCMGRYNREDNSFVLNLKDEVVKFSVLDLAEAKEYLIDYKIEAFMSALNQKCLPYLPPEKQNLLKNLESALRSL